MRHFLFALWCFLLATSMASAQGAYRIQPGDTVIIEILEDTSLNRSVLVLPDGTINVPFLGSIRAAGRTTGQLKQSIASGIASNFVAPPTVFVSLASLAPPSPVEPEKEADTIDIYFVGEVNAPGIRPLEKGTTFLQAVAQSGGFTRFAATRRIQLRRAATRAQQQQTLILNYKALSNGAALQNDITLKDGDVILVPQRRLFE